MKKTFLAVAVSTVCGLHVATAATTLSTVSGTWYDPTYSGSGFNMVQFSHGLFAYFYGYKGNNNGEAQWLLTQSAIPSPVEKGKSYTVNMVAGFEGNGATFTTKPATANSGTQSWGSMTLTFNSCDSGVVVLNGKDGQLTHNIIKLGSIKGLTCTETSTDDTDGGSVAANAVTPAMIERTVPSSLGSLYTTTNQFNRYIKYTAPNGKPIHIVAQTNITDEQILRSYNILKHYLSNYPGSQYGADKTAVANKMADNQAILALLNGSDNGQNPVANRVTGQPLYQNEIQVEGHSWYMNQDYTNHRDAAYEEILHWVHDNGIGVDATDGTPSTRGALPAYQAEIRAAQKNGLTKKLWGIGSANWIAELTAENSLSQEYLAAVVDSYYGLWGAYKESATHGMWGMYVGKDRADIKADDPMGYALMENKFFHPYVTYNARIDASLTGNFSLKFDASKSYTHHSRYLKSITLLGSNAISVTVNELDNDITGNSGLNTVIFSGKASEYTITKQGAKVIVSDTVANRNGKNTLRQVEKLQFSDTVTTL